MTGAVNYSEKALKILFWSPILRPLSPASGDNCSPCPTLRQCSLNSLLILSLVHSSVHSLTRSLAQLTPLVFINSFSVAYSFIPFFLITTLIRGFIDAFVRSTVDFLRHLVVPYSLIIRSFAFRL